MFTDRPEWMCGRKSWSCIPSIIQTAAPLCDFCFDSRLLWQLPASCEGERELNSFLTKGNLAVGPSVKKRVSIISVFKMVCIALSGPHLFRLTYFRVVCHTNNLSCERVNIGPQGKTNEAFCCTFIQLHAPVCQNVHKKTWGQQGVARKRLKWCKVVQTNKVSNLLRRKC